MNDPRWSEETEAVVYRAVSLGPEDLELAAARQELTRDVLAALADAGLLVTPSTSDGDLYVVVKTVSGREPEILADMVSDLIEVWEWVNDMTNDPDRDPLATYVGYRLGPIPPRPAEVQQP